MPVCHPSTIHQKYLPEFKMKGSQGCRKDVSDELGGLLIRRLRRLHSLQKSGRLLAFLGFPPSLLTLAFLGVPSSQSHRPSVRVTRRTQRVIGFRDSLPRLLQAPRQDSFPRLLQFSSVLGMTYEIWGGRLSMLWCHKAAAARPNKNNHCPSPRLK